MKKGPLPWKVFSLKVGLNEYSASDVFRFKEGSSWHFAMRTGHACSRCKQVAAVEGDLWCSGCSSWESLGRELAASWDQPGCRILATDLVLNCARQVRALRSLGAGLSRASNDPSGALRDHQESRGEKHRVEEERVPLERKRRAPPPPIKDEESGDIGDEDLEEEESEEEDPPPVHHQPIPDNSRRPPEPEGAPPSYYKQDRYRSERAGSSRAQHHKSEHRSGGSRRHHSTRRPRKRAGRKHQRLYRLAADPTIRVHRKIGDAELQLSCLDSGRAHLDRDIL